MSNLEKFINKVEKHLSDLKEQAPDYRDLEKKKLVEIIKVQNEALLQTTSIFCGTSDIHTPKDLLYRMFEDAALNAEKALEKTEQIAGRDE